MYDAVLFDLDGTLIDTETLSMAAGLQAFATLGVAVETAFLHSLIGIDQPSSASLIRAHVPDIDLAALNMHWSKGFRAGVDRGLNLKAGVHELLAAAPGYIHRAVVTSSGRTEAHHKIGVAGLRAAFPTVVTVDDVTRAKPDPEPYCWPRACWGCRPRAALCLKTARPGPKPPTARAAWWCRCLMWCKPAAAGRITSPPT